MNASQSIDEATSIMVAVRRKFVESGMTLQQLGIAMGYPVQSARKSAWQFIHQTNDPRFSMLVGFCLAMDITVDELWFATKQTTTD